MKKIRFQIEVLAIRFCTWLLPKLPRKAILELSQAVGWLAYLFDYKGRPVAKDNLRKAFKVEGIHESQVERIAIASYQTFARTFFDLFWSLKLTKNNYQESVGFQFLDPSTEKIAREKGAVWVTPHYGNFELISLANGFRGCDMTIVAQDFKNPALTEVFRNLRQGGGGSVISQQGAMFRLMKALKNGGHVALLTDLNIKPGKIAFALNSFGMKCCATLLHVDLARRLSVPVIPCVCVSHDDGTYKAKVYSPMYPKDYPDNEAMAQAVWDIFEMAIREKPEGWLWMYKHWRYRPAQAPDENYPFYANVNRSFEKLLVREKKVK